MPTPSDAEFVSWFRSVAPYFHAFRGKTFVLAFGGEVFSERRFVELAHDINLLHSTGIRVILVHGSRPQIEAQLRQRKARSRYALGLRVTPELLNPYCNTCATRSLRCSRSEETVSIKKSAAITTSGAFP